MESSRVKVYLFAGDRLTEGNYGESYVERVGRALDGAQDSLKGEVVNAGRGGDTVASLLSRIDRPLRRYQPSWVILAVGGNDVWHRWLSSHSAGWWVVSQYRKLKYGQVPATDLDEFAAAYRALIDKARQVGSNVMACTISPLGERLSSPVNRQVARLNGVIKHVAAELEVPVADVWQAFVEELAVRSKRSGYVPGEWLFVWSQRRRMEKVSPDEFADRRRLHLTFDGIHLNSRGADLWAKTVLEALARAQGDSGVSMLDLARRWNLPCFGLGSIDGCYSPGWEVRARDLGGRLEMAYKLLAARTGAAPNLHLAVLNTTHWNRSACSGPYPRPASLWDGERGTIFAPEAYGESFLRERRVPEVVAGWASWSPSLSALGEPAKATVLADLLVIEELARLFMRELRVAPSDPVLSRLLASYLTQVVLYAMDDGSAGLARLWNAWGQTLALAGNEDGQVRMQAKALYDEHGEGLVSSFTGQWAAAVEQGVASPTAGP
jgi:lysophospholipase L1-like esterase